MDQIRKLRKQREGFLRVKYSQKDIAALHAGSIRPDGSWSDLDYAQQNFASWDCGKHLDRLRYIAAVWGDKDSPLYHSRELAKAMCSGITYWDRAKRVCGNWWWNDIFVPQTMGHIMILAYDLLKKSPDLFRIGLKNVRHAAFGMTGQNRIWKADAVMFCGILEEDETKITAALDEITAEIVISSREGIRTDGCFHQHGPQIQLCSYGLAYFVMMAQYTLEFAGTKWALPENKLEILRHLAINGFNWVLWKKQVDMQAKGRNLNKGQLEAAYQAVKKALTDLQASDPEHAAEYRKVPCGNKMFFNSDFMVHRNKGFYASLRMNSVRTCPVETDTTHDNSLGEYFSDGCLLVMRSGKEYHEIAPCWDWTRLPGTTAPATPVYTAEENRKNGLSFFGQPIRRSHSVKRRKYGETFFTGGVSNGKIGAAVYTMDLNGVKARKSYFFWKDFIVALGCDIQSVSPYPVATTVEQNLHTGDVRKGKNWVWHNGIGYYGKNMTCRTGIRKGDWQYICGSYNEPAPVEADVFTLTIEHGLKPVDASYEYAVFPGIAPEDMKVAAKRYTVLANTPELQAIRFEDGTVAAIFHAPGYLEEIRFGTETPGAFIIKDLTFYASDPTCARWCYHLRMGGEKRRIVLLPEGEFAGSTVRDAFEAQYVNLE